MISLLFAIVLAGDEPHVDHATCAMQMMTAVEILADHDIAVSGWCADGAEAMGPDELATTEPQMVRPKQRPEWME